ncbi:MAG: DUF3833 domain-containing protein [Pseudomonadota bacterium]
MPLASLLDAPPRQRLRLGAMARLAAALGLAILLAACAGPSFDRNVGGGPDFALERYFDGRIEAWGVFQDRAENVRRTLKVTIDGTWDGETLTLDEDFIYEDGATEKRIWVLRKDGPNRWVGTAEGVVGEAVGIVEGNALNWKYEFDLVRPNGDVVRVDFDDWMYLQDDRVMINRAYVSKFGFEVGQLSLFFVRDEPMR